MSVRATVRTTVKRVVSVRKALELVSRAVHPSVAAIVHARTAMRVVAISSVRATDSPVRADTSHVSRASMVSVRVAISLVSRASMVSARAAMASSVRAMVSPVRVAMVSSVRVAMASSVRATVSLVRVAIIQAMATSPAMVSLTVQPPIRKVPVSIRPTTIRTLSTA